VGAGPFQTVRTFCGVAIQASRWSGGVMYQLRAPRQGIRSPRGANTPTVTSNFSATYQYN
jgi:hypothetical protein